MNLVKTEKFYRIFVSDHIVEQNLILMTMFAMIEGDYATGIWHLPRSVQHSYGRAWPQYWQFGRSAFVSETSGDVLGCLRLLLIPVWLEDMAACWCVLE